MWPDADQGVGLYLCKDLANLMGGELYLDESYDSGIPGHPGARFVVALNVPPKNFGHDKNSLSGSSKSTSNETPLESIQAASDEEITSSDVSLPDTLSVLFVDDDLVLRKLFARSLRKVAPGWMIREAANGETALPLMESQSFDIIFMDMYMASVEKQLLGTETVVALQSSGVTCRICGLSANDLEEQFLDAGADSFLMKPFPCDPEQLKRELVRILNRRGSRSQSSSVTLD